MMHLIAVKTGSQIVFVKSVLWYYGYGSLEFYQLPGDGSEGSRELLLAFSWLLQRISLLEQILYLHKAQLKDTVLHCTCKMNDTKSWQISEHSEQHLEKQIPDIRCIQWLQGKLDFRFKVLHAMQQAKCGATYKIHHYTRGCHTGQNHLSIMEVNLIQDPSSLNKVLHTLESENARLDAYLEWKRLEPIYWHWMESVLDAKLKDNFECAARPLNTSTNDCTHCSDDCPLTEIGQLTALVETLQNELQENMSRLKTQWSARVKREEKKLLDEELFVEKLKKLQNEVELKFASAREKWRRTLKHGTYQLLLQEDPFQVKKGTSSISRNKELHGNVVKASEMVADLQKTESLLQNELTVLQEECRNHLKQIAGSLQGIICIPPVKT
ncbi:tubulin epsilon and delta complex protein 1 isoform X2 [Protopterus annectens]|uniref:tubulin epsilon and delta complex protein 1 isoform X2 n=1 Tax=Protopterus annectens TaxID=7888 RepID=UPI001CFA85E3|nr:tubulin epsilon and delta complex protein 1 isoform X2 [Protopterus annectens]